MSGDAVRLSGGERLALEVGFEEETEYAVLLQGLDGTGVALSHRDPVVTSRLVSSDGGRVVHGGVRFGSQAGRTTFAVWSGGRPVLEVEATVLPTKVSERAVWQMRSDVEAVAAGLALSALRPAVLSDEGGARAGSPPVWLAALRASVDDLERSVREIERRPVLEVVREVSDVRTPGIRRASSDTRRAASSRGVRAPVLPARPATETSDTPAHRWLASELSRVRRQLRRLVEGESRRRPTARRARTLSDLEGLASRVDRVRRLRLFDDVGARAPLSVPLVLRRHPVYASAFHALRGLDRGLALRDGALDVATQDLSALYETWCVLEVVRSFARALEVAPPDRWAVDVVGADVRLRRGRRHAVVLEGDRARVEVVYEPRFPAPPALLAQRPDLLVTVRRGREAERVVLDAKYRRDDSDAYRRRYGAAGPPEDALGTLHRYRDAIVEAPRVRLAAALFPGTADPAYDGSRLWTSLHTLGVGAVPVQPGVLGALDRLTRALVA